MKPVPELNWLFIAIHHKSRVIAKKASTSKRYFTKKWKAFWNQKEWLKLPNEDELSGINIALSKYSKYGLKPLIQSVLKRKKEVWNGTWNHHSKMMFMVPACRRLANIAQPLFGWIQIGNGAGCLFPHWLLTSKMRCGPQVQVPDSPSWPHSHHPFTHSPGYGVWTWWTSVTVC